MSTPSSSKKEGHNRPAGSDSRETLLQAAKKVFANKGYDGATVKDLADAAGVNISLISYHFGGKENLYKTCLESFGFERIEAAERILKEPLSKEDFKLRLKLFAEDFIHIHQRDRDTCKMIHRGITTMDPVSLDLFKNVFIRIFMALEGFMRSASNKDLLKKSLDIEITTGLMFGALVNFIRMDELRRATGQCTLDDPNFMNLVVEHWVETYTQGIFA